MKATIIGTSEDVCCGVLVMLDPPHEGNTFVVVSALGDESYIFAASPSGKITDWCELAGSQKNTRDKKKVLRDLGYEIHEG